MCDDNNSNTAKAFMQSWQQQSQSECDEDQEWTEVTFTLQKASYSTAVSEPLEKVCAQNKAIVPAEPH